MAGETDNNALLLQQLIKENELLNKKIQEQAEQLQQQYSLHKNSYKSNESVGDNDNVTAFANAKKEEKENTLLHQFFNTAPAAMCILSGPDHVFEFTNPGFATLFGRINVMGKTVQNCFPEVEQQGFIQLLDNVYKSGNPFVGNQVPVMLADTKLQYYNFIYQPFFNDENTTKGIFVFAYNVTETVLEKERTDNSEQELKNVIDSAPFPIGVYVGEDLKIHIANKNIIDIFGKGPDVIGKSYKALLPELENQLIIDQMLEVLKTGNPFHAKDIKVEIDHDGKIPDYYFNYSFTPIKDAQGKTYAVMNTAADVTEINIARIKLEQSEKRFRGMADFMPQFVWTANKEGGLNYYNQAVYNYSGHTPETLATAGWLSIVHPDDRDDNIVRWTTAVQTGTEFNVEHRFKKHNGEFRWQQSKAVPIRDEDGSIQSWIGVSADIQEQKNFAERLEKMVGERTDLLKQAVLDLERSNSELSQFAYVASHDLQEPLRKIRTFLSRIQDEYKEKKSVNPVYLDKIDLSAERMSNLIRDILEFSAAGKGSAVKEQTSLNNVLHAAINDLEIEIQTKAAKIEMDNLPDIFSVPAQMHQLFHNLLSNSLKFASAQRSLKIIVRAEKIKANQIATGLLVATAANYYKIIFSDNGIGFDQQYATLIFTIFQRLHEKSLYEGTGIGLALCKKIMDNHNGFIQAEATPERGATFTLFFPA